MAPSEAVLSLRTRLGLNRQRFAKELRVSYKMIQRIEAGQAPTTRVLVRLAAVARDTGADALAELFEATRRAKIAARVGSVEKTKRVRRVALSDLKYWSAYLFRTAKIIESLSPQLSPGDLIEHLRNAAWDMHHIREEIEYSIDEPYSLNRIQEDSELLGSHRMKPTGNSQMMRPRTRKR